MECKNDADTFKKKVNEIMALLEALKENRGDTDACEEIHKQLDEYRTFLDENYLFIDGEYDSCPCLQVDHKIAFFEGFYRTRREIKSNKKRTAGGKQQ